MSFCILYATAKLIIALHYKRCMVKKEKGIDQPK